MAAVAMAASSLAATIVAAPAASLNASASYSTFSSVRMAPLRSVNRRLSVVAMSQNEIKKGDLKDKVSDTAFLLFS